MPVTLTCYGGVGEIGGNKVLLEDGDSRLLLDFGIAFGRQQSYFNEFLRPRAARGLLDLLALDLIPPLEGLYRDDLAWPSLWERFREHPHYRRLARWGDEPVLDGVLVSHAHMDHHGDLSYVDPRIPVHTGRVTACISRAMQVTGQSNFEREVTFVNPRLPSATGELVADRRSPYQARSYGFLDGPLSLAGRAFWEEAPGKKGLTTALAPARADRIGGLPIRWWPVDHSIPGAMAFAVQTSAGWIGYTGDIRFHGKQCQATQRFVHELAALRPIALLCEGTHVEGVTTLSEAGVVANALPLVRAAAGKLAVVDFAPRNIERLHSFLEVAKDTSRRLVVQPKDVYLLQAIALADPCTSLHPKAMEHLALYADPKAAPRSWEVDLRAEWADRTVTPDGVSADPGAYLLAFSLWDANDLLDLRGIEGGVYLYSNSRTYDEEQAADLERLRNWVRIVGLTLYGDPDDPQAVPLHASGHASGSELLDLVRTVRPGALIPIHTERPDWWSQQLTHDGIAVRQPEAGVPLRFMG